LQGYLLVSSLTGAKYSPQVRWLTVEHHRSSIWSHPQATYIMFHFVEGVPFESNSGVWDRLTMWEQIDGGEQYTPAKKWLTSLPICLYVPHSAYTRFCNFPVTNATFIVAICVTPS
jgi:hypothetical protein